MVTAFRNRLRISLGLRISSAVALLVFMIVVSAAIYVYFKDRNIRTDSMKDHGMEIAEQFARMSADAVLLDDYDVLKNYVIEIVENNPHTSRATILDKNGRVLACSDTVFEGKILSDSVSVTAANTKEPLIQFYKEKGEPFYDIAVPLEIEGNKWGLVRLGISLKSTFYDIELDLLRNSVWAFFGLVFGFFYSLMRSRSLTQPLDALSHHINSSSSELLAVSQELASGSTEQAASVNETTATLEELGAAARQIADNAGYTAQTTEQALASVQEGQQVVESTIHAMEEISQKTKNTAQDILSLGERSQQIGAVMEIIDDIAEQTNLLALNASIEAARAGEAGKGFAVVATEIRKLAENVADSTSEVKELITELQSSTSKAVMTTEEGMRMAEEGAELVRKAGETFKHVIDVIAMTTDSAKQISLATQQQQSASEQSIAVIKEIDKLAEQTAAASKDLTSSAQELDSLTRNLQQVLGPRKDGQL